jgi:hypothetical protein
MQAVAPTAAIVTTDRADKDSRFANQGAFALNGWAKNFGDAQGHGRYSAQVLGVSLTSTTLVSGQRATHQS